MKSTIPTAIPAKYPATIPIKKGITFKNPFAATATTAVTKNATNATTIGCHSKSAPDTSPICSIADGASPKSYYHYHWSNYYWWQ